MAARHNTPENERIFAHIVPGFRHILFLEIQRFATAEIWRSPRKVSLCVRNAI